MTIRPVGRRSTMLLAGSAALVPAVPAAAQVQTWTAYTYNPAATVPPAKALAKLCEDMEKATNGQLVIKSHLGGSLPIQVTNITQAVSDNVVQLGDDGFFQGNVPIGGVMRLPMLINSPEEFAQAGKVMQPFLEAAYAKKGVLILGYYAYPLQVAWSRRKLTTLDELKGMKMRTTSPEQSEFVRRFGGIPVTIGAPEVPSALDRGIVEGVFTAASGGGRIWKDLLKFAYDIGPNYFDSLIIVNKEAFEKLPADTQAKLRAAAVEAAAWNTRELAKDEGEVRAQLKATGMTITAVNPADVKAGIEKLTPYWDEWAKQRGPDAVAALGKVRAMLGR
jgi:TRAP-type C4-dicarboxylate transport system substrate-binding protein